MSGSWNERRLPRKGQLFHRTMTLLCTVERGANIAATLLAVAWWVRFVTSNEWHLLCCLLYKNHNVWEACPFLHFLALQLVIILASLCLALCNGVERWCIFFMSLLLRCFVGEDLFVCWEKKVVFAQFLANVSLTSFYFSCALIRFGACWGKMWFTVNKLCFPEYRTFAAFTNSSAISRNKWLPWTICFCDSSCFILP